MDRIRRPSGAPGNVGGQFAPTQRRELTAEEIFEAEGHEDPWFDPDDQYGADLVADEARLRDLDIVSEAERRVA